MDKTEQLAEMVIQAVQFYFEKKVEPILKSIAEVKSDLVIAGSGFASLAALDDIWSKLQALEDRPVATPVDPATIASEVSRQIALLPPPADGKSVDLGAIFTEIGSAVTRAVAEIPRAVDGKDGTNGADGKDGANGKDGENGRDGVDGKDGTNGERGADGINGKDGASVTLADVVPLIKQAVDEIPRPVDGINGKDGDPGERGADGINGKDGKDAVLDAESVRRDIALEVHRELSTWERPKDGLGIEDWNAELKDDGRTLVLTVDNGTKSKAQEILIPWQIYRGLWEASRKYQKGDVVTYGGSQFTAKVDTDQAPKTDDWLLSVKRG